MTIVVHDRSPAQVPEDLLVRWRRIPVAVAADLAPERQIDPASGRCGRLAASPRCSGGR